MRMNHPKPLTPEIMSEGAALELVKKVLVSGRAPFEAADMSKFMEAVGVLNDTVKSARSATSFNDMRGERIKSEWKKVEEAMRVVEASVPGMLSSNMDRLVVARTDFDDLLHCRRKIKYTS